VFLILRTLHELIWLLTEAKKLCPCADLAAEIQHEIALLDDLAASSVTSLVGFDWQRRHQSAHGLLRRVGLALGGSFHRRLPVLA
jgi:hypothetical protein